MRRRPYQREASDSTFEEWKDCDSTLIVMPTGTGKTVVAADIAKRAFPRRTIFIAPRRAIVQQAKEKIERAAGMSVEVEMGEYKSMETGLFKKASVIVSTIQTQTAGGDGGGRMGKFNPEEFGVLICDEAHHYTSPSYRRLIEYFRSNPRLKVVGLTATPDRADEEALGQVFETVAYDYEILDAIHDGWLVPIEQQMVHVGDLDFSSVRTTAGDLNGSDLEAIMVAEKALYGVASPTIEIVGDKRTIVFTSSVKHAQMLSEIFNRYKPGCSNWVCGKTKEDERLKIFADFASGATQIVCNCGVLTEGFDAPWVEYVVMARPTKSRSLYAQMCGRSTRPHDSIANLLNDYEEAAQRRELIANSVKPCCRVIDFVGNAGKHKLMTTADILGGKVSEEAIENAVIRARTSGRPLRMDEVLDEEEERAKEREQRRLAAEARRARLAPKTSYKLQNVNPFDVLQIQPVKSRGWDSGKTLSEKQRNFLRRMGLDPDKLEYSQAKQLIGEMISRIDRGLCSLAQANILRKYGYETNVTKEVASKVIDAIAQNGWKRPAMPPRPSGPPPRPTTAVVAEAPSAFEDDIPF